MYVELEVLRNNDTHAPRFSQPTYTATASEGLPIGAFVTAVTVSMHVLLSQNAQVASYIFITGGNTVIV